jgi:hypothetical protein
MCVVVAFVALYRPSWPFFYMINGVDYAAAPHASRSVRRLASSMFPCDHEVIGLGRSL